jgi:hypothetical protein
MVVDRNNQFNYIFLLFGLHLSEINYKHISRNPVLQIKDVINLGGGIGDKDESEYPKRRIKFGAGGLWNDILKL